MSEGKLWNMGLLGDSDNRMGLRYVIMSYVTVLLRLLQN